MWAEPFAAAVSPLSFFGMLLFFSSARRFAISSCAMGKDLIFSEGVRSLKSLPSSERMSSDVNSTGGGGGGVLGGGGTITVVCGDKLDCMSLGLVRLEGDAGVEPLHDVGDVGVENVRLLSVLCTDLLRISSSTTTCDVTPASIAHAVPFGKNARTE